MCNFLVNFDIYNMGSLNKNYPNEKYKTGGSMTFSSIEEETFHNIVEENKSDIAFIVGNGINIFSFGSTKNSWESLLLKLWNKYISKDKTKVPDGITYTEFYDVLELHQNSISETE